MPARPEAGSYDLFILGMSVYALVVLGLEAFLPLSPATRTILGYADIVVCGLFLLDFLIQFARASNRARYFATWGWLDLLSSVPFVGPLRIGRAGRVVRIVRVLRAVRSTRRIAAYLLEQRAQGTLLAATLLAFLLVVVSSIVVLPFEAGTKGNIQSPADAMWWSLATITTVGYGDRFPVSNEGRIVGACLMAAGIGLFGVISGFIASWFLGAERSNSRREREQILEELLELKRLVTSGAAPGATPRLDTIPHPPRHVP